MTIEWTNAPPPDDGPNKYRLIRTPQNGKIEGIILSEKPRAVWTHYYGGRTTPCRGDDCQACASEVPRRWHCYVMLWGPRSDAIVLFELTTSGAEPLYKHLQTEATLRGLGITTRRMNGKPNGPVHLTIMAASNAHLKLPKCPDEALALLRVWKLREDPTAYNDAPLKRTRVKAHYRKENANGASPKTDVESSQPQQPGRPRRTDGLPQSPPGTRSFPESAAPDAALD